MNSGTKRQSLAGRLFCGVALAVGALAASAHVPNMEQPAPDVPVGTVSYTFDDEGRLLSLAHNGVTPDVLTA